VKKHFSCDEWYQVLKAVRLVNHYDTVKDNTRKLCFTIIELRTAYLPGSDIFERFDQAADDLVLSLLMFAEDDGNRQNAIAAVQEFKKQGERIRRKLSVLAPYEIPR